ncbi:hypothetical protein Q4491_21325 [Photobacterium sp. 2_MG-2023]|nr:hypothetical protein [Photobacterium sp. 2_MG-2023]
MDAILCLAIMASSTIDNGLPLIGVKFLDGLEPLDQPLTMQRRRVQADFVLVELGVVAADLVGLRKCRDRHPKENQSVGSGRSGFFTNERMGPLANW